jgi:hypothetical protein
MQGQGIRKDKRTPTMTILTPITSFTRRDTQWLSAGESVKLIATHGHVLIVENERGGRFPVHESKVGEYVAVEDEPVATPKFTKREPITNRPAKRKVAEGQTEMF